MAKRIHKREFYHHEELHWPGNIGLQLTIMTEFIIPFLLMARFPVNDIGVYHGPQYVFNVSRTYMEELHNKTIIHGQMTATMKCQNSSITNLICKLNDFTAREYVEILSNSNVNFKEQNSESKLFNCINTKLCDTFEIQFNKSELQGVIVNKNLFDKEKFHNIILLKTLIMPLNIFYINQYDKIVGSMRMNENVKYDNINATIKLTKEILKIPDDMLMPFEISSIKGFDGFKYTYKITHDAKKLKKNSPILGWGFNILSNVQFQPLSFVHRLIISPHQFTSMNDEEISLIMPNGEKFLLINKFLITLHAIEPALNSLSPVIDPVFESIY
ncbi:hypothetical protein PV328_010870 [Microctonus aethiopoides]|uniref:Uncharacterized protein n=1 Tax=Microctonus aethiopoides TaxID=144406 RepID=A0AA39KQS6_9HYME|nr:hypothetical protein PV328_010870 [Microctonus aethiopoides]